MNNGWIKLYRKSKDNPLMRDANAWMIFSWIMLTVDRRSGEMTLGRFWASEYFGMNPNTFYSVLKRLENKFKVTTHSSNNKFTTIRVLNWAKYQDKDNEVTQAINNPTTTKQQPDNTLQEVKNIRIKNNGKPLQNVEVSELIDYLKTKLHLPILDESQVTNRRYAYLCIRKFGFEKTKLAIDATAQNKFWHTKITSFKGLYYNVVKIVSSGRGEVRSINAEKILDNKNEGRQGISAVAGGVRDIKGNIPSGT